ncbi:MAG: hypothetical protein ACOYIR_00490 [Christensenellales bacterium]
MGRWQANLRRHVVSCPHCGKDVLDHMTQCPFCKGKLKSRYYTSFRDPDQAKALKRTMRIVGFAIAAVIFILLMVKRYSG